MFAKARSAALGAGFLKGKALLDRSSFRRRLAWLWAFSIAWLACATWLIFSFGIQSGWLTVAIMVVLFLTAPEPWLLIRTYDSYLQDWRRANNAIAEDQGSASRPPNS